MKNKCEILRCSFYQNNECTDKETYINKKTKELVCRYNVMAIKKEKGILNGKR